MTMGPPGLTFVTQMERGFKDFVAEDCDGLDVVFEVNVGLSSEDGLASTEDALTANPELDAVYTNNDDLSSGAAIVLEEQGRLDDVVVTGFNGDPTGIEGLQAGRLDMTVALRPYHWGYLGVETMVRYLDGADVGDLTEIETLIVDYRNIESVDLDDLR